MEEMLKLLKETSPIIIILVVLAFFGKFFIEKRIEGLSNRIEEINKTSLEVKREIRSEERGELVDFRVAIEKWEYFLLNAIFDYSMNNPLEYDISDLYKQDKKLFLNVKISIVKSCIYLRNQELEQQLMNTVLNIRKTYYPIIYNFLPQIIDIQFKIKTIENKIYQFQQSGMKDMSFAPTEQDRLLYQQLQSQLTEENQKYSDTLTEKYKEIAVQLDELKDSMNQYIYRPIKETAINKE